MNNMREGEKFRRKFIVSSDDLDNILEGDLVKVACDWQDYYPVFNITGKAEDVIEMQALTDDWNIGVPAFKKGVKMYGSRRYDSITVFTIEKEVKEETDKLSELVFDEDESEALYRIMGNLSRGQVETCQVYENAKFEMINVWQKILDWGHENDIDIHGDK